MMNIAIYQIDPDRDQHRVMFESYDRLVEWQGNSEIDASIYGKAFEGTVEEDTLEGVFQMFNLDKPDGYSGRSVSVSDVIAVRHPDEGMTEYFYCDSIGFRQIDFDEDKAAESFKAKIRVVLCEPGKLARITEIGTELEDLQRAVGGLIETYYPFEEQVCIVCNDEGKINGMRPCRAIYDEERNIRDIIFGPFFICDCSGMEFGSLNAEQLDRYGHMFQCPENYYRVNGEIKAIPYFPSVNMDHVR